MSELYEKYCEDNESASKYCTTSVSKIHPSVKIWDHTDVVGDVTIGEGTILGRSSFFYGKYAPVVIGKNCQFIGWNFLDDGAIIGDNVFVGGGTQFTSEKYPVSKNTNVIIDKVIVEDFVVIGANCTILPGITIGRGSIVGAGSVVTKDIPEGVIVYGNPAEIKRKIGK